MLRFSTIVLTLLLALQTVAIAQQSLNVAFVTRNAYGNNLYLDNITAGHQMANDVAVARITNIAADTSYLTGGSSAVIAPGVTVVNLGTLPVGTPFTVTFTAAPGGYTSTKTIASLARGAMVQVVMDSLTIPASQPQSFTVVTALAADEQRSNDTLRQSSFFLPGVRHVVLLEQWTSSTCGPCAANNPTIDAFVAAKSDSLVAVKYHVGWPSPWDDPMYLYNPVQSYDRRDYYGVSSVPHVIMDGLITPSPPYTAPSSLPAAFAARRPGGTPIGITVRDSALAGDSVEVRVTVIVYSVVPPGSYRLRVQAVERRILYAEPPGTNGEQEFLDVFRGAYPSSAGTALSTAPGTYEFSFRYKLAAPAIRDSLYTIAFVQNDVTREVLNVARRAGLARGAGPSIAADPGTGSREVCVAGDTPARGMETTAGLGAPPPAGFTAELLELGFPPSGWRLSNPDGATTIERYAGVNGPSFGGAFSSKIDFYSYSGSGQTDTLFSSTVGNLLPTDTLTFDWAYAQFPGYSDRLIVKVSTNGGLTFDSTIFDLAGASLATAPSTTSAFEPLGSQWRTYRYPLAGLIRPLPAAPALVQPPDGATNIPVSPLLTWNRVPGALTYRLQVSPDSAFSVIAFADSAIADSSRTVPALSPGGMYYWRVRATGEGGTGAWSAASRFSTTELLTRSYPVRNSWNLLAIPLTVSDASRQVLFPTASSEAYRFDPAAGYVRCDTLRNGIGYWLKFPEAGLVSLTGFERGIDSIALHHGWNLIGSLTLPVPSGAVQQVPDSIVVSSFYGYGGGYTPADTIRPAQGYWVKASAPGMLILEAGAQRR